MRGGTWNSDSSETHSRLRIRFLKNGKGKTLYQGYSIKEAPAIMARAVGGPAFSPIGMGFAPLGCSKLIVDAVFQEVFDVDAMMSAPY